MVQAEAGREASDSVQPLVEALSEDVDPGWELDRLNDAEVADDDAAAGGQEDALMAATYVLAPPPAPARRAPGADTAPRGGS